MKEMIRRRFKRLEQQPHQKSSKVAKPSATLEGIHPQRWFLGGASCLGMLSVLLPWWESPDGYRLGIMSVVGVFILMVFAAGATLAWSKVQNQSVKETLHSGVRIAVAIIGVLAILAPWLSMTDPDPNHVESLVKMDVVCSWIYLAVFAGFLVLISSVSYLPGFEWTRQKNGDET